MSPLAYTLKHAKRIIVTVVGVSILCLGVAMVVLPGPAFVVIPIGLGILSTEFIWARNLLHRLKDRLPARLRKGTLRNLYRQDRERQPSVPADSLEGSQEKQ